MDTTAQHSTVMDNRRDHHDGRIHDIALLLYSAALYNYQYFKLS